MTITVTQNITSLSLTVTQGNTSITLSPTVNTVSNGSDYVIIDGFNVYKSGKTDLEAFEVGDRFFGWNNDRYVVGKIITLPVSLPDDLYDETKVGLAINNAI